MVKKTISKVSTKIKAGVFTRQMIVVGIIMASASVFGFALAAAPIAKVVDSQKAVAQKSASCTPTPPYRLDKRINNSANTISLTHRPSSSNTQDVILERREVDQWGNATEDWKVVENRLKTGIWASSDLSAYPNKWYEYRAIAYNGDCWEPYSNPVIIGTVSTNDFWILEDDDPERDIFYPGKIRNINRFPWYDDSLGASNLTYREDSCMANYLGQTQLYDYSLVENDTLGPMGRAIEIDYVVCPNGCIDGACTVADAKCEPGFICNDYGGRNYVDEDCMWSMNELPPNEDYINYRCRNGEFVFVGDKPEPGPKPEPLVPTETSIE